MGSAFSKLVACACLTIIGACFGPAHGVAHAQDERLDINRPSSAARLTHRWDFEDAEETLEVMPRNWFRSLHNPNDPRTPTWRPGFPRFNESILTEERAWEGKWSFMLPTLGGSTSAMLARGVAPVQADSDMLISVMVLTEGLEHARARVVARLLDITNQPIEDAFATSDPIISNGAWTRAAFELTGVPEAVSLQIELQVLQETQLELSDRLPGVVLLEDVEGRAYFDDLRVYQIPRVELTTEGQSNITVSPERVRVSLSVRDLVGSQLRADMRLYDRHSNIVDTHSEPISLVPRPIEWQPEIDRFGWYRVAVTVRDRDEPVAHASCDLAWLSPLSRPHPDDALRFGVVIPRDEDEISSTIPLLVDHLATGSIWIEMWNRAGETEDPWRAIGLVIERLLEMRQGVTFVLERIPSRAAESSHLDSEQVLMLLAEDSQLWLDRLAPLLTRFGERVRRWQLGPMGSAAAFEHPEPIRVAEQVRETLYALIPRPVVVLPWTADQAIDSTGVTSATFLFPSDLPADSIPQRVRQWNSIPDFALIIEQPDSKLYGVSQACIESARRAILAWEAGVPAIGIDAAWRWRTGRIREAMPRPIFPVWRTLSCMLSGRQSVGELPGGNGLRVLLAGPRRTTTRSENDTGLIVAWNESALPEQSVLRGYLGTGEVTVRDLYGNVRVIEPIDGHHEIHLTDEPVFIEGVDTTLLRFRAGLRIEPGFIELRAERVDAELVIENPWRTTISGHVRLDHPEGWQIAPRAMQFVVRAGETVRIPLTLTLGLHNQAGIEQILAHVSLTGDRNYPPGLVMPIEMEVGLEGLLVNPAYKFVASPDGGEPDLVLTVLVTNIGDRSRMLEILAGAPGYPRKDSMLTDLAPGQAAVRRFLFRNAAESLRGQRVGIAVREREGTGRWNTRIEIR